MEVLYIEDDEADVDFVRTVLNDLGYNDFNITVVEDGEEAIKFLTKEGPYAKVISPDLILLDLNLPKINGKEILKHIKRSANLKNIPVIIFSTSGVQEEVDETYQLGSSGYFKKPNTYEGYKKIFGAIYAYWTANALLPSKNHRF